MSYKATIIIPTLNEVNFLKNCIKSIVNDCLDFNNYEVFIVDGGSTDGTNELISELKYTYSNIKYFNNLDKYAASAMNIGISESTTDYIIRLDAHAIYLDSYIDRAINFLKRSDLMVANVGGTIDTKPSNSKIIPNIIAYVLKSSFGVGNSKFRTQKFIHETEVDTVPFGCFKKKALIDIGLYNENEYRGEDLDLNTRLIKKNYKVILLPELKSIYYSRDTYISFVKQTFKNGYTVFREFRGKKAYHKIRHYIPCIFILFQIMLLISLLLIPNLFFTKLLILVLLVYVFLSIIFSIRIIKSRYGFFSFLLSPLIFYSLHTFYGLGSLIAIMKLFINFNSINK